MQPGAPAFGLGWHPSMPGATKDGMQVFAGAWALLE